MSLYRLECVILVHGDSLDAAVQEFTEQLDLLGTQFGAIADVYIANAEGIEELE